MAKEKTLPTKANIDLKEISKYEKKISGLAKIAEDTVIENDEGLEIAKGNLKQTKEVKKIIDDKRKEFGTPFREVVEHINETSKYYIKKAESVLNEFNIKIIGYTNIAAAQREAEEAAERKRVAAEAEGKETVIERYIRLRSKMYAVLVGGQWTEKGQLQNHNGCKTSEQANTLHSAVSKTFPKAEEFGHLAKNSRTLLASFGARCAQFIAIKKSADMDESAKEIAIDALRDEIIEETNQELKSLGVALKNETRQEIKKVEQNIAIVSKGIKDTVKFNVIDEEKVPKELCMVDDRKVNSFIRKYREKIMKELKAGNQPIAGISFYVDKKVL